MTTTDASASRSLTDGAIAAALHTVSANAATFGLRYPADTTTDGVYALRPATDEHPAGSNLGWTTSFWPGQLWLATELTDREVFRDAALDHVASFAARVRDEVELDTHDLGFLYTLSCVTAWRLEGDVVAREAALAAADALMVRFLEPAGIIQAWGDLSDPRQRGRTIIDSLMNLPLLRWASVVSGDRSYGDAADRHAVALRDHILRPDGTTFHTFYWDAETGAPLRGATEQGESDSSCWARGQAWGIFGFALTHRETGDESFLEAARRCADHFLEQLPPDGVPYWDLALVDVPRDSSAAAITVCGLDELVRLLPENDPARARYADAATGMLDALVATCTPVAGADASPLLLHGVYDMPRGIGVDEGTLWGDYYFLEALTRRALPQWRSYWWVAGEER
ncbi:glycoside hydrolase family 88 protein [Cellulomonas sp. URHE0023]|uniref:glycoside hydrolase family 88 protein n=1 Tax=Cellulomonas sp. URHE0023 TaxID=1380354 RepID=UPI00054F3C0E|nr:glycoside hydrolase family 88 protein [Cellulomonas sp. URHE0023]